MEREEKPEHSLALANGAATGLHRVLVAVVTMVGGGATGMPETEVSGGNSHHVIEI